MLHVVKFDYDYMGIMIMIIMIKEFKIVVKMFMVNGDFRR